MSDDFNPLTWTKSQIERSGNRLAELLVGDSPLTKQQHLVIHSAVGQLAQVLRAIARCEDYEARYQELAALVERFIDQRPEYVQAMRNTTGDEDRSDYCRWSGHAEARRQLAASLGKPAPHEVGEHVSLRDATDSGMLPDARAQGSTRWCVVAYDQHGETVEGYDESPDVVADRFTAAAQQETDRWPELGLIYMLVEVGSDDSEGRGQ